jgi:Tfp pilus assembly PilM family ATPase
MQVLVGITKKESVALVQRISLDAGFDIDGVDPDPMAAYNLLMACKPERRMPRTTLLVIGSTRSWVVASEQGMPIAVREIDVGVQKLIDNLTSGGLMSPEHAEKTIFTTAEPGAIHPEGFRAWGEEVIEQLARSVPATRDGGVATGRLYLSGGGAQVPGLAAVLMAAAAPDHVDVETFDPLMSLTGPGASGHRDGPIYTVALGLALRGLDR